MLKALPVKKITLLGTTGAGKTTFLEALFGEFAKNDVRRDVGLERSSNLDFVPIKDNSFRQSTTTISFNVISSIIARTLFNKIIVKKFEERDQIDFENVEDAFKALFNDPAGQDRFSFMQEIVIKGSHLVIIMADGTNIASLEKIPHYIQMVEAEEATRMRSPPAQVWRHANSAFFQNAHYSIEVDAIFLKRKYSRQVRFAANESRSILIGSDSHITDYWLIPNIFFVWLQFEQPGTPASFR